MVLSVYARAWRPTAAVIRSGGAQAAHEVATSLLRLGDAVPGAVAAARVARRSTLPNRPTVVGGVRLPHPLIVAAGLVKGDGFDDEYAAGEAVRDGRDIVPGWRVLPALLGAVEFGSYTRRPRKGNRGRVVWRDDSTHSMQNRVGLRNPGVAAAAGFLRSKGETLPRTWGVSLAPTPGVTDLDALAADLDEGVTTFVDAFDRHPRPPQWYSLNLSCPNTEDDPDQLQTDALARSLAGTLVSRVRGTPVWVKVGPALSAEQYRVLAQAFADTGVRAVVATNTLPRPAPRRDLTAGVSGDGLRAYALEAVAHLSRAISADRLPLDIVGSGGVRRGRDLIAFEEAGARAAMLYSALVFRGPLAPALILREAERAMRARRTGLTRATEAAVSGG